MFATPSRLFFCIRMIQVVYILIKRDRQDNNVLVTLHEV